MTAEAPSQNTSEKKPDIEEPQKLSFTRKFAFRVYAHAISAQLNRYPPTLGITAIHKNPLGPLIRNVEMGVKGSMLDNDTQDTVAGVERGIEGAENLPLDGSFLVACNHLNKDIKPLNELEIDERLHGGLGQPVVIADEIHKITGKNVRPIMESNKGAIAFIASKIPEKWYRRFETQIETIVRKWVDPITDPIIKPIILNFGSKNGAIFADSPKSAGAIRNTLRKKEVMKTFFSADEEYELKRAVSESGALAAMMLRMKIPIVPSAAYTDKQTGKMMVKFGKPIYEVTDEELEAFKAKKIVDSTEIHSFEIRKKHVDTLTGVRKDIHDLPLEKQQELEYYQLLADYIQYQVSLLMPEDMRGVYSEKPLPIRSSEIVFDRVGHKRKTTKYRSAFLNI